MASVKDQKEFKVGDTLKYMPTLEIVTIISVYGDDCVVSTLGSNLRWYADKYKLKPLSSLEKELL
jgi:hypothetical protein